MKLAHPYLFEDFLAHMKKQTYTKKLSVKAETCTC